MQDEVLAEVRASAPRRVIGVGTLTVLGGLLIYTAFDTPPPLLGQLFLIGFGAVALWAASVMLRTTSRSILLTRNGLFDSDGTVLARMDNIDKVDRSMFANKPSNGFLVILKEPQPRAWRLGMWWRIGRRLAVGGVTPGSQTRPMSDILRALHEGHLDSVL